MNEQHLPAIANETTRVPTTKPKDPFRPELTSQQRAAREKVNRDADIIEDLAFAASMASSISISEQVGASAFKVYRDRLLEQAGNPTDPVERMLIEQLVLAHHRIAQLHVQAEQAKSIEVAKMCSAAAARLTGEFRRLALAIRQYRSPVSSKQFTVVKQQNLANGDQKVAYLDQSTASPTQTKNLLIDEHSEQGSRRLIHAPADQILPEPETSGSRSPEPQETRPVDRRGT